MAVLKDGNLDPFRLNYLRKSAYGAAIMNAIKIVWLDNCIKPTTRFKEIRRSL